MVVGAYHQHETPTLLWNTARRNMPHLKHRLAELLTSTFHTGPSTSSGREATVPLCDEGPVMSGGGLLLVWLLLRHVLSPAAVQRQAPAAYGSLPSWPTLQPCTAWHALCTAARRAACSSSNNSQIISATHLSCSVCMSKTSSVICQALYPVTKCTP